ncbi:SAL1 phosphatase [Ananas comosus]|uniref:3'(2'),5'-bisphosphate nucleotidase n=1 Tax=Ananas comosus TaxID=4615 RepID=A0A199ULD1_ANACO|nr:SAL1 phosphatase [Ananas comosus]OAY65516.1 3'(2'),5'-bisphosphate nucleotidase [Ananas comosus]
MATRTGLATLSASISPNRLRSPLSPSPSPSTHYRLFSCSIVPSLPFSLLRLSPRRAPPPSPIASMSSSSSSSSSSSRYDKEIAAAKKAASLAARLCQKVQKALVQSDVQSKSDKSPVTIADYGSQALVSLFLNLELSSESFSLVAEEDSGDLRKDGAQETLKRITDLINETLSADGSYTIQLSEEGVLAAIDSGKSEGGPSGRHWVLDPIDGTKGFLRGDQYAIALALLDEGKVVLGVLACPNLPLTSICNLDGQNSEGQIGCLFSAVIGCGTEMQSLDGSPPTKIQVSSIENPAEAAFFESFEAAHSMHDLSSSIAEKLGVHAPPVRIDSQAKYGALARGDGAIYLRFPHKGYREKIWDHAAGCIVVTEAGGVVTDAAGNSLDFSKGRYLDLDTGIVVTNKKLMPSLLNAVKEAIRERDHSASLL